MSEKCISRFLEEDISISHTPRNERDISNFCVAHMSRVTFAAKTCKVKRYTPTRFRLSWSLRFFFTKIAESMRAERPGSRDKRYSVITAKYDYATFLAARKIERGTSRYLHSSFFLSFFCFRCNVSSRFTHGCARDLSVVTQTRCQKARCRALALSENVHDQEDKDLRWRKYSVTKSHHFLLIILICAENTREEGGEERKREKNTFLFRL